MLTATLTAGGQTVTLVTNTYDVNWLSGGGAREWVCPDSVCIYGYYDARSARGNVTRSVAGHREKLLLHFMGQVITADDGNGHSVAIDTASRTTPRRHQ